MLFQLSDVLIRTSRRYITSIEEAVDIQLFYSFFRSQIDESQQMADMAVNAAIGKQTQQMKGGVVFQRMRNSAV